jgi:hypothetical protein
MHKKSDFNEKNGFSWGPFKKDSIMQYFLGVIAPDKDGENGFKDAFEDQDQANNHLKQYE